MLSINCSYGQFGRFLEKVEDKLSEKKEDSSTIIPEVYEFQYEYQMEIKDKNGATPITFLANIQEDIIAMIEIKKDEKTIFLTDHGRKKSLVYMEGNGNKGRASMPYFNTGKFANKMAQKHSNNSSIEPTGNTKMIAGFECDEYITKDDKTEGYLYINHNIDLKGDAIFGFQNLNINDSIKGSSSIQPGLVMAIYNHKKNEPNKKVIKIECIKLTKGKFKIVNNEYYNADK